MNRFGQLCYTYLLGWKSLDVWYYGYRAANKLSPYEDLPIYLSSSTYVKSFIENNGKPDIIRVHKCFESKFEAKNYETRFITKVNAVKSQRWLNRHDGGKDWGVARFFSNDHKRKISESKMGHFVSNETKQKMSEKKKEYYGTDEGKIHLKKMINSRDAAWNIGVPMSDEQKSKISKTKRIKQSQPGYVSPNKGIKRTLEQCKRNGDVKRGIKHSEEHKKKNSEALKASWAKRKASKS